MGGAGSARYETPANDTPTLLTHGGPTDVFGGILYFQQLVEYLATHLRDDGHYVLPCYHTGGHRIPTGGTRWGYTFLTAHAYGTTRRRLRDMERGVGQTGGQPCERLRLKREIERGRERVNERGLHVRQ